MKYFCKNCETTWEPGKRNGKIDYSLLPCPFCKSNSVFPLKDVMPKMKRKRRCKVKYKFTFTRSCIFWDEKKGCRIKDPEMLESIKCWTDCYRLLCEE